MAGMFAYLVGSPQLLMGMHGLGPTAYGVAFGANAFGLILASQVIARLVRRWAPGWLLPRVLALQAVAGLGVLLAILAGALGPVLATLALFIGLMGAVLPLASALAMAPLGRMAGSASALLGTLQFGVGAVVGAVLGAFGGSVALPMAVLIGLAPLGGLAVHLALRHRPGKAPPPPG
jgi:DHA1 family bicyclomycin/chloramphenicol resistance-like MFS transporter